MTALEMLEKLQTEWYDESILVYADALQPVIDKLREEQAPPAPTEKHEHTPGAHSLGYFRVCCSCGQWRCTQKSHLGRSAIIECGHQHAEHVKEQNGQQ